MIPDLFLHPYAVVDSREGCRVKYSFEGTEMWLSSQQEKRCGVVVGDGEFRFPVVGESHYQTDLEKICGPKCERGTHERHAALLLPEPINPYDKHAVCVKIRGTTVGYLSRDVAPDFLTALKSGGYEQAASEAIIVGGWSRPDGDEGDFGVKLNAVMPFIFMSADEYLERMKGVDSSPLSS